MSFSFVSYTDLIQDTELFCSQNPQWRDFAGVVAIPRSGILPATQIAVRYNLPLADIYSFLSQGGRFFKPRLTGQFKKTTSNKILLVDDSVWSGESLLEAIHEIADHSGLRHIEVVPVAIYGHPANDMFQCYKSLQAPRVFEWNWQRNNILQEAMLDMDGILCDDPTYEVAPPDRYRKWLSEATPRHLPTQMVRAIVSARLEIYRPETEAWLAKWGIRYHELCLFNGTLEEREVQGHVTHAEHKVQHFSNSNSSLFIESSLAQAAHIHKRVGKAVLCPSCFNHPTIFFKTRESN